PAQPLGLSRRDLRERQHGEEDGRHAGLIWRSDLRLPWVCTKPHTMEARHPVRHPPRFSGCMRSSILPRIGLAALVAASVAPRSVAAQGGLAGVAGSVVDSIHGGVPLQGAIIKVGDRQAKTDANGRFQVDSIPPGSYSLTLIHPLLDTLGISITTRAVPFQGGHTLAVEMAIPSAQTVLERSCAPAWRARGPSALVGKVLDADTETPLVGAKVSLVWYQLSLTTLKKEPVYRSQPVGPDGTYRICGLPGGVDGTVQAEFNGRKTAEVRVVMDEANPLGFQSLRIGTTVVEDAAPDTAKRAPGAVATADTAQRRLRGPARLTGR